VLLVAGGLIAARPYLSGTGQRPATPSGEPWGEVFDFTVDRPAVLLGTDDNLTLEVVVCNPTAEAVWFGPVSCTCSCIAGDLSGRTLNLGRPLAVFLCPADARRVGTTDDGITAAFTFYLGLSGGTGLSHDGVLFQDSKVRIADVTDGASNTLLAGERPPSPDNRFGWWYAGIGQSLLDGSADSVMPAKEFNRTFYAPTCPPGPYQFGPGSPDNMCDTFHYWSRHPGGAHFAFADGAVRFLRYDAAPLLPALATRAGGEAVVVPD
jgi:prepilin-type processing-associated H-X9-DG protein